MSPLVASIIIIIYFSFLLVISWITSRNTNNAGFFLGNRKAPWYIISIGMIGSSISGATFISVPGTVGATQFTYLQMVMGFFAGYIVVANVLLPLYYKLNLTSIYTYLEGRFGFWSYKSGATLFLISRTIGAAARLYLMANVLQIALFNSFNIPFEVTVFLTIFLIWVYTFKGGIKTIIWTDLLQTFFLVGALIISIIAISTSMHFSPSELVGSIINSPYSKVFEISDWSSKQHFLKQFFSGMFITIVMTGLDQDMMQKNLSCRSLKDAQKNMYWYGFSFLPVNILFLSLGALLFIFAANSGIQIPKQTDDLYPMLATQGYLTAAVAIFFFIGLIAATYASADSALASLTTSFSIDILNIEKKSEEQGAKIRFWSHVGFSLLLGVTILIFNAFNNDNVVNTVFTLAGYTYGPLLGLYAYGLFSKRGTLDKAVPFIALLSPVVVGIVDYNSLSWFGFKFGFEKLMINGAITYLALFFFSFVIEKKPKTTTNI